MEAYTKKTHTSHSVQVGVEPARVGFFSAPNTSARFHPRPATHSLGFRSIWPHVVQNGTSALSGFIFKRAIAPLSPLERDVRLASGLGVRGSQGTAYTTLMSVEILDLRRSNLYTWRGCKVLSRRRGEISCSIWSTHIFKLYVHTCESWWNGIGPT
jgi:hypothetical protein